MIRGRCGHPVRGFPGEVCGLDEGHRGHHSCVARYCEGGHMVRAGQIVGHMDEVGDFCWWHVNRPDQPPGWWDDEG